MAFATNGLRSGWQDAPSNGRDLPPHRRLAEVPGLHLRRDRPQRDHARARHLRLQPRGRVGAQCSRRGLPRHLRGRAGDPDHRLRASSTGLLQGGLERLRLRRDRARVPAGAARQHHPAALGAPTAGGAPGQRDARPPDPPPGDGALAAADQEPRPTHGAAHVHLRDGGLDPVPRAGSGAVGQHRRIAAQPVPDPHARELARVPRARPGDPPGVVDLRLLRPARLVPGDQRPAGDHHQLDGGGPRGRARRGAPAPREEIASADGTVAERLEEIRAALDRLEAQLAEGGGDLPGPARSIKRPTKGGRMRP